MSNLASSNTLLNLAPAKGATLQSSDKASLDTSADSSSGESFLSALLGAIDETNQFLPERMQISEQEITQEFIAKIEQEGALFGSGLSEKESSSIFETLSFMQVLGVLEQLKISSSDVKLGNLSTQMQQLISTEANLSSLKNAKDLNELLSLAKNLNLNVSNIKVDKILQMKESFPTLNKQNFFANSLESVFKDVLNQQISNAISKLDKNTLKSSKDKLSSENQSILSKIFKELEKSTKKEEVKNSTEAELKSDKEPKISTSKDISAKESAELIKDLSTQEKSTKANKIEPQAELKAKENLNLKNDETAAQMSEKVLKESKTADLPNSKEINLKESSKENLNAPKTSVKEPKKPDTSSLDQVSVKENKSENLNAEAPKTEPKNIETSTLKAKEPVKTSLEAQKSTQDLPSTSGEKAPLNANLKEQVQSLENSLKAPLNESEVLKKDEVNLKENTQQSPKENTLSKQSSNHQGQNAQSNSQQNSQQNAQSGQIAQGFNQNPNLSQSSLNAASQNSASSQNAAASQTSAPSQNNAANASSLNAPNSLNTLLNQALNLNAVKESTSSAGFESLLNTQNDEASAQSIDTQSPLNELNSLVKDLSRVSQNELKSQVTSPKETLQNFAQDLKEQMAQFKAPLTRLNITLNPSNLGEVEVTLVQRGANLHINFNSNTQAMNLFIQNQAEFKNSLVNMGFTGLEMNFSDQGKKEQNQKNKSRNQGSSTELQGFSSEEKPNLELVLAKYF